MVLAGEPVSKDSLSLVTGKKNRSSWSTYNRLKIEQARENGVKALLIVVDDIDKDITANKHRLESPSMKFELDKEGPFVLYISKKMANHILGSQSTNKDAIEEMKVTIADS